MNFSHTENKKIITLLCIVFLFSYAFGEVKSPCYQDNSPIKRPQCVCDIRDFMEKVNKGLSSQDGNQNKLSNAWLFVGNHTSGKSSIAQDITREVGVELVSVSLQGTEADFMDVVRAISQAQKIMQQNKSVFLIINDIDKANDLTSNELRQHALRTQDNHHIMTILTANKLSHIRKKNLGDDLLYYDKVYFPALTFHERVILLKKQNPDLSDFQAKKLALMLWNFSEEDIQQIKNSSHSFLSCMKITAQNSHLFKNYSYDFFKIVLCSTLLIYVVYNRNKITHLIPYLRSIFSKNNS